MNKGKPKRKKSNKKTGNQIPLPKNKRGKNKIKIENIILINAYHLIEGGNLVDVFKFIIFFNDFIMFYF